MKAIKVMKTKSYQYENLEKFIDEYMITNIYHEMKIMICFFLEVL